MRSLLGVMKSSGTVNLDRVKRAIQAAGHRSERFSARSVRDEAGAAEHTSLYYRLAI
jgi:hypothetical protein